MGFLGGVHLLPSTGEFTYDTIPYEGARAGTSVSPINTFFAPGGSKTDYSYSIDQLQAAHPECATVSIVCAWFCDGLTPGANHLHPSTTYIGGTFQPSAGGTDEWRCSSLNQTSAGLIAIPTSGGSFIYGGTPSDQSIVRCIRDLKSRGFKVAFYPFILMTATGQPWRGRMTYSPDLSSAATAAVTTFLGAATTSDFIPDSTNLTVAYSGSPTDYTYRRMILHYAWLTALAGGVNLFVIGSELRGLETIRGPSWTPAGTVDGSGNSVWDYPFVAGLQTLANDVRTVLNSQGLTKDLATLTNLVTYSADWSDWMGYQHPGENGQWPHLDSLWASSNIDLVSFDNYLPLSDWTTGETGLDQLNWLLPTASGAWPPSLPAANGLGLSGPPTIYSIPYLQANLEGGEKFNWFYDDGTNGGPALDPNGSAEIVSQPQGDRAAQARSAYSANQQILANKQLRWWWNNLHYAIYANLSGAWVPQSPRTEWVVNSKPIVFLEYGVPSCDKGANQPNVFYSPMSTESDTPYWSEWQGSAESGYIPVRDDTISTLALEAIYQYWLSGSNNETVGGVAMLETAFCCAWNWDARPFPIFPILNSQWGDAGDWEAGNWLNGRGPALPPAPPSPPPSPGTFPTFPMLATLGWSTHVKPRFSTDVAEHVSGRSVRRSAYAAAYYDVELTYDVLRSAAAYAEMQAVAGFFAEVAGQDEPFWLAPPGIASVTGQALGTGDGSTMVFALQRSWGPSYVEPVYGASGVSAVYLNGVPQGSGWSVSPGYGAAVTFATAPGAGVAISADFGALWLCRFAEDVLDFEEFMAMLFELQIVKLRTTTT
jgi:uncharacterized protein (TIGR02217 family)